MVQGTMMPTNICRQLKSENQVVPCSGGDDKKRGKAELRHKPQPATADYNKPLRHSLEVKQARKQPERPDRRHLSDSLGIGESGSHPIP